MWGTNHQERVVASAVSVCVVRRRERGDGKKALEQPCARARAPRARHGRRRTSDADIPLPCVPSQIFYSFFKTLVGKEVVVELKNGTPPLLSSCSSARIPQPPCPDDAARPPLNGHTPPLDPLCFADLAVRGTLHSVDQYLNIKLLNITVEDKEKFPHMQSVKNTFIRGSVIKYVQLPASEVDTELLQDATRRETAQQKSGGK